MTTNTNNATEKANAKPTHTLRKKTGYGKNTEFETIGVAWTRDDGGFYVKLHGTQLIDSGFYAFPIKAADAEDENGQ